MLGVAGGSGLLTRIIFGGVCDNINVRREENELGGVLTLRAGERERDREREREGELHVHKERDGSFKVTYAFHSVYTTYSVLE